MQPEVKPRQLIAYLFIFVAAPTLTYLIGGWIDSALGLPIFPGFPFNLFSGMLVIIIGLNLGIKSTRQLYQTGKGLPWGEATHEVETSSLVTSGIYAYSRNPMVLGYSLLPVGMGLMFQSIGMVLSLTPAVLLLNYLIVKTREEPRLVERFGEDYENYRSSTPFLFPDWSKLLDEYLIPYLRIHREQLNYVALAEISLIVTTLVVQQDLPVIDVPHMIALSNILFSCICILGIIAGIAPNYLRFSGGERHGSGVSGHHPDCGCFRDHVVRAFRYVSCAGCSGLVLGASLALISLMTQFNPFDTHVGFWFGALLVSLGLAQHFIDLGSGWVHLLLNVGFVYGDWLMFDAVKILNPSFSVILYLLSVTMFWIFARIRASQWTHIQVCKSCLEDCILRFE